MLSSCNSRSAERHVLLWRIGSSVQYLLMLFPLVLLWRVGEDRGALLRNAAGPADMPEAGVGVKPDLRSVSRLLIFFSRHKICELASKFAVKRGTAPCALGCCQPVQFSLN